MVRCIKPQPKETIQDPAAGTAGFLIAADQYMRKQTGDYMDISFEEQQFQSKHAFVGVELVPNTRRLALMNCLYMTLKAVYKVRCCKETPLVRLENA